MNIQDILNFDTETQNQLLIKNNISRIDESRGNRSIFFVNDKYLETPNEIQRKFNGLIINRKTKKVVACGPPPTCYINEVPADFESFSNIEDGTSVLLYYYENSWRLSTHRAYDINNMKPPGFNFTYGKIFFDLMPDELLNKLNREWSYNFIINHKELHPFQKSETESKLIFVSPYSQEFEFKVADIDCIESDYSMHKFGIGYQMKYFPDQFHNYLLPDISGYLEDKILREAKKKTYWTGFEYDLGYIFYRKDGTKMILESPLMRELKLAIYNEEIFSELKTNPALSRNNIAAFLAVTKHNKSFPLLFRGHELERVYISIESKYEQIYNKMLRESIRQVLMATINCQVAAEKQQISNSSSDQNCECISTQMSGLDISDAAATKPDQGKMSQDEIKLYNDLISQISPNKLVEFNLLICDFLDSKKNRPKMYQILLD